MDFAVESEVDCGSMKSWIWNCNLDDMFGGSVGRSSVDALAMTFGRSWTVQDLIEGIASSNAIDAYPRPPPICHAQGESVISTSSG